MKNKKLLFLLAFFGLSMFVSTAGAQVSVYANSWTSPGPSICDGHKFEIFNVGVSNYTDTAIYFKDLPVYISNSAIIDSVFLLDQSQNTIAGLASSKVINFNLNIMIDKYENTSFFVVIKSKIANFGNSEIKIENHAYTVNSRLITFPALISTNVQVTDCSPKFKITVHGNLRQDGRYCENERPGAYTWIKSYSNEIVSQKWFVNGKEVWAKDPITTGVYLPGETIMLQFPSTKIILEVVDAIGRVGRDSTIIDVVKSPVAKISASTTSICSGEYAVLNADTLGLLSWAWNWNMPSKNSKTALFVFEAGTYNFTAVGSNGCTDDTLVFVYELPKQEKLSIESKDTMLWVNEKTNQIEWYCNDTLITKNGQFIESKKTGFYFVKARNAYGCSSVSDVFRFDYVEPKNPCPKLPKPDLALSNCKLFANINWQQGGMWEWSYSNKMTTTSEPEIAVPSSKAWWKVRFSYDGCYSEYSNAVFVECISTGLNNVNQKLGFSVYPNPAIDQFTIESSLEKGQAQLVDMQGRVVKTLEVQNGTNTVYREGLAAGVYSIIFNGDATKVVFQ